MKKILLGLGTIAVATTSTVAVVSCSVGSVFKSKINSVGEAKEDLEKIFGELSDTGTLANDVDKYTNRASAKDVLHFEDGITETQVKGLKYDVSNLELKQGRRKIGYADWTGTHNDFYSNLDVTLSDGKPAHVTVFFEYDKTNGVWTTGKKSALWNAAIGVANLSTKLKHVISDITISTKNIYKDFDY